MTTLGKIIAWICARRRSSGYSESGRAYNRAAQASYVRSLGGPRDEQA